MTPEPLYLDHAATTPLLPEARDAWLDGMARWANPSSPHASGRAARAALEAARERMKAALGWPGEVIFTSGANEALAIAIERSAVPLRAVSAVEHDAVLRLAEGSPRLAVGADGLVRPEDAAHDGLVAVQHVNNETGVIQPLGATANAVHEAGGRLLADCAQSAGKMALPNADLIAISAHKFGGPIGVGALLVRDWAMVRPSGGQERGYRPGTENLPGALAMLAALEAGSDWIVRASRLRARLEAGIVAGGGTVIGQDVPRLATIGAYRMPGVSSAVQLIRFDAQGIAVSAGSACSSGSLKASHVLTAMGVAGAGEVVRVSIGRETTEGEIDRFPRRLDGDGEAARGGMIYLDYQATTPLAPEAREAMLAWLGGPETLGFANPHSPHRAGRAAAAAVEVAREQVAALMPPGGRVIFTGSATEALNLAILGSGAKRLAVSAIEHTAVLDTACAMQPDAMIIPVDQAGIVAGDAALDDVDLVAVMQVNNEIGTIQPIDDLARSARAAGALFVCDAVQGAGKLAAPEGADMIAISAHKLYGPKGIGALWVRDGVALAPQIHGGGQEQGLRSGTLSPALCAGFGMAAKLARERMDEDGAHVRALWQAARAVLHRWTLNGSNAQRWHGNLNVRLDGLDVARLMSELRTIAFSAGSACASGSGRPSHVLTAIGLDAKQAKSSVRLGFGRYTSLREIEDACASIEAATAAQGV